MLPGVKPVKVCAMVPAPQMYATWFCAGAGVLPFVHVPVLLYEMPEMLPLLAPAAPTNVQEPPLILTPVCHRAACSFGVSKLLFGTERKSALGKAQLE